MHFPDVCLGSGSMCVFVLATIVQCQASTKTKNHGTVFKPKHSVLGKVNNFKHFHDVTRFLHYRLNKLRSSEQSFQDHNSASKTLAKRDTIDMNENNGIPEIKINSVASNEISFEKYEHMYLLEKTTNYLKQIYFYSKFREQSREKNDSNLEGQVTVTTLSLPTPHGISGDTTTSSQSMTTTDSSRVDPILELKLQELNALPLNVLSRVFHNIRQAAESGLKDPGIASLCCPLG